MDYQDTVHFLNPPLFSTPPDNMAITIPTTTYSVVRNKPRIWRDEEGIRASCRKIYKFSNKWFEDHTITFPRMTMALDIFDPHPRTLDPAKYPEYVSTHRCLIHGYYKWGLGYYHFITEILPSLLVLQKRGVQCPIITFDTPFIPPLLDFFQISFPITMETQFPPPLVVVSQPYIECGNPSLEKIEIMREIISQKVVFEKHIGILIRRSETYRNIVNHDDVLEMLRRVHPGIEWRVFTAETIPTTAEWFSQAKIIVAPHGAGLTNMLFSPVGIPIVEFMPSSNPNMCYWHLSEMLRHSYHMIPCREVGKNLWVDIADTARILTQIPLV